jgi:hypothetical protein
MQVYSHQNSETIVETKHRWIIASHFQFAVVFAASERPTEGAASLTVCGTAVKSAICPVCALVRIIEQPRRRDLFWE